MKYIFIILLMSLGLTLKSQSQNTKINCKLNNFQLTEFPIVDFDSPEFLINIYITNQLNEPIKIDFKNIAFYLLIRSEKSIYIVEAYNFFGKDSYLCNPKEKLFLTLTSDHFKLYEIYKMMKSHEIINFLKNNIDLLISYDQKTSNSIYKYHIAEKESPFILYNMNGNIIE